MIYFDKSLKCSFFVLGLALLLGFCCADCDSVTSDCCYNQSNLFVQPGGNCQIPNSGYTPKTIFSDDKDDLYLPHNMELFITPSNSGDKFFLRRGDTDELHSIKVYGLSKALKLDTENIGNKLLVNEYVEEITFNHIDLLELNSVTDISLYRKGSSLTYEIDYLQLKKSYVNIKFYPITDSSKCVTIGTIDGHTLVPPYGTPHDIYGGCLKLGTFNGDKMIFAKIYSKKLYISGELEVSNQAEIYADELYIEKGAKVIVNNGGIIKADKIYVYGELNVNYGSISGKNTTTTNIEVRKVNSTARFTKASDSTVKMDQLALLGGEVDLKGKINTNNLEINSLFVDTLNSVNSSGKIEGVANINFVRVSGGSSATFINSNITNLDLEDTAKIYFSDIDVLTQLRTLKSGKKTIHILKFTEIAQINASAGNLEIVFDADDILHVTKFITHDNAIITAKSKNTTKQGTLNIGSFDIKKNFDANYLKSLTIGEGKLLNSCKVVIKNTITGNIDVTDNKSSYTNLDKTIYLYNVSTCYLTYERDTTTNSTTNSHVFVYSNKNTKLIIDDSKFIGKSGWSAIEYDDSSTIEVYDSTFKGPFYRVFSVGTGRLKVKNSGFVNITGNLVRAEANFLFYNNYFDKKPTLSGTFSGTNPSKATNDSIGKNDECHEESATLPKPIKVPDESDKLFKCQANASSNIENAKGFFGNNYGDESGISDSDNDNVADTGFYTIATNIKDNAPLTGNFEAGVNDVIIDYGSIQFDTDNGANNLYEMMGDKTCTPDHVDPNYKYSIGPNLICVGLGQSAKKYVVTVRYPKIDFVYNGNTISLSETPNTYSINVQKSNTPINYQIKVKDANSDAEYIFDYLAGVPKVNGQTIYNGSGIPLTDKNIYVLFSNINPSNEEYTNVYTKKYIIQIKVEGGGSGEDIIQITITPASATYQIDNKIDYLITVKNNSEFDDLTNAVLSYNVTNGTPNPFTETVSSITSLTKGETKTFALQNKLSDYGITKDGTYVINAEITGDLAGTDIAESDDAKIYINEGIKEIKAPDLNIWFVLMIVIAIGIVFSIRNKRE